MGCRSAWEHQLPECRWQAKSRERDRVQHFVLLFSPCILERTLNRCCTTSRTPSFSRLVGPQNRVVNCAPPGDWWPRGQTVARFLLRHLAGLGLSCSPAARPVATTSGESPSAIHARPHLSDRAVPGPHPRRRARRWAVIPTGGLLAQVLCRHRNEPVPPPAR